MHSNAHVRSLLWRGVFVRGSVDGMPNGKPGDDPVIDMLLHGMHPFPSDVEDMIRTISAHNPVPLHRMGTAIFGAMAKGERLSEGRAMLSEAIQQLQDNEEVRRRVLGDGG